MLKNSFFLLLFFFCFQTYSQNIDKDSSAYKAYYYDNGIISSEGYIVDGKPNGYWITYYPNGLRKAEGNRVKFELNGIWRFYDKEGNLKEEIEYKNGIKEGVYRSYKDCFLQRVDYFQENVKDSISTEYFLDSSNTIKSITPFEKGRKEGISYEYGKNGRIITIVEYKKGFISSKEKINRYNTSNLKSGLWKDFYPNLKVKEERRYKDDKLNGYYKYYGLSGQLDSAELYIMGVKQEDEKNTADFEILTDYYENGSIKETSVFNSAGNKNGVNQFYNKDGSVDSSKVYSNGNVLSKGLIDESGYYQGYWEYYYISGKIKAKGEYKDGNKVGEWIYYFENGNIEQKGKYDTNGKYTSKWTWYYENGKVLRTEDFLRGVEDGYLVEYDINGNVITEGEYLEGEKEGEWFYKLNDHEEVGKYLYGERNGYWEFKHPTGKVAFKGEFQEGIPNGEHLYYNDQGVLIKKEEYTFGEKDGKWVWYDDFGIETLSITYKDNQEKKVNGEKMKLDKIK